MSAGESVEQEIRGRKTCLSLHKNGPTTEEDEQPTHKKSQVPPRIYREWEVGETYDVSLAELEARMKRAIARKEYDSAKMYQEEILLRMQAGTLDERLMREVRMTGRGRDSISFAG